MIDDDDSDWDLSSIAEAAGSRGYAVAMADGEFIYRANRDGAMMELQEHLLALDDNIDLVAFLRGRVLENETPSLSELSESLGNMVRRN